jgi:hypothetical protein
VCVRIHSSESRFLLVSLASQLELCRILIGSKHVASRATVLCASLAPRHQLEYLVLRTKFDFETPLVHFGVHSIRKPRQRDSDLSLDTRKALPSNTNTTLYHTSWISAICCS